MVARQRQPSAAIWTRTKPKRCYRNYIELILQEAGKYGIYVDFCPYEVRDYYLSGGTYDGILGSIETDSLNFMAHNQRE